MTRDLHDLLSDALTQSTGALAGTADDSDRVAHLRTAVRRRRATRATVRSTSVACVAVVVGAVGWLVAPRLDDPAPAHTPSPSVSTANPTPTATPTPTPSPTVAPATVVLPGLPPMPAATPGLLASTSPGWVLFRYAGPVPASAGDGPEDGVPPQTVNALVLASPEGERFHVVDLAPGTDIAIDRWVAGSTTADVTAWSGENRAWGTVDLITGEVATIPTDTTASTVGWTRAGERVTVTGTVGDGLRTVVVIDRTGATRSIGAEAGVQDASDVAVDPSGRQVLLHDRTEPAVALVVDLLTDGSRAVGQWPSSPAPCFVVSWIDDEDVLVRCTDGIDRPTFWRVDTSPAGAGPVPVLAAPADPSTDVYPAHDGVPTGDGGVAFMGTGPGEPEDGCDGSAYVWRSSTGTIDRLAANDEVSIPWPTAGLHGDVYLTRMPVCADLPIPEISRVDGATGATTILVPVDPAATVSGAARSSTVAVAPS